MRCSILLPCLLLLLAAGSSATTYIVDPDGTGNFPTIQAAIDFSSDGDIIELAAGTFRGDGNRNLDLGGKAVTVRSQGDVPEECIIDCGGSDADPDQTLRGFTFNSGEGPGSIVRGITITNGVAAAP